jgi:MFS family permease
LLQGIGLAGVALLWSMLAPGFYWLVAAQMLLGFGLGITRVACLMVIVTGTPRAVQGRANNLLEFSAIAGLTLSPTLSGLAASLLHWRAAFAVATVFVAGAFGWVLYTRQTLVEAVGASAGRHNPDTPAAAQSAQRLEAPAAPAERTSVVGIAYVATFVLSFIWSGFVSTALPLFGGEVVGIPTSTLGLVFTAGLLVDLILLLPIGWLSDRLEGRVVLTPALLLMAGALAYLPQATSLGGLFVVSICLHTGFAAWGPSGISRAYHGDLPPACRWGGGDCPLARWHAHRAVWLWPAGLAHCRSCHTYSTPRSTGSTCRATVMDTQKNGLSSLHAKSYRWCMKIPTDLFVIAIASL